jgi:hypothetical protein
MDTWPGHGWWGDEFPVYSTVTFIVLGTDEYRGIYSSALYSSVS